MKKTFILMLLIGMMGIIAAWPFSINLSTGEIFDLNSSNNETVNLTIYIYNYTSLYENKTVVNTTNITNITNLTNLTCFNCTNNYTNLTEQTLRVYNYTIADNGSYFYNTTQAENLFVKKEDFNIQIGNVNTALAQTNNKADAINTTVTDIKKQKNTDTWVWVAIALALLLGAVAFYRASGGGE